MEDDLEPHWLAVDRCFIRREYRRAVRYATDRLVEIERRPVSRVEAEAAVVHCPMDHVWKPSANP